MDIPAIVGAFLKRHSHEGQPVLLALSGGVDSLVLFHSLLSCRDKGLLTTFGVAHVDHCWRPTSTEEAKALGKMVEKEGLPWHCHTLQPEHLQGNLEEACRLARLDFFAQLCCQCGYRAVILGHHADDQAETVLKRLFEGASLTALGGIKDISLWRGMAMWRPLLQVPKAALSAWIKEHDLMPIDDISNYDRRYLRARMRSELLPHLAEIFGKQIAGPLAEISAEARELEEYLMTLCSPILTSQKIGWLGRWVYMDPLPPLPPLAVRFMLRKLLSLAGCGVFSTPQLHSAAEHLLEGTSNKLYSHGSAHLYIDRRRAFALPKALISPSTLSIPLAPGTFDYPPWRVTVVPSTPAAPQLGWQQVWQGYISVTLPAGDYILAPPRSKAHYPPASRSLDSLWSNAKVPPFLRPLIPLVWQGESVFCEFLSGRQPTFPSSQLHWQLILENNLTLWD